MMVMKTPGLSGCSVPEFYVCARRRTFLTGASPESARWWEGYSRRQGCPS
ncbi:hypothetical protein CLOSTHATH_05076 [Hungatella hathewayi DSM 13479]|uniref:Uncharacterized protein n=1 Tax=Hungatella hathewayi DSM 13479 TaxID=566550 RepID=D3AN76_9FIRM|nr:hypothetical protein CLOSTHATH_05076 [Hungatella hathewayi DSM 13479]